jgi:hypothetical protein
MENGFNKYIGSIWRQISLCVKILVISVVLFALALSIKIISFYINLNSGGMNFTSAIIFNICIPISGLFFLLIIILTPICFIESLIKIRNPINITLTILTIIIIVSLSEFNTYLWNKIKSSPGPDSSRGLGINISRGRELKELGKKFDWLKNDKDFTFTEQFLEPNEIIDILTIPKGKVVLNSNLLNKKPSEISDNVVVIFESTVPHDKGNIGGPNDISTWWHYGRGSLMVFGDSRVEFVKVEDFNNLRWKP